MHASNHAHTGQELELMSTSYIRMGKTCDLGDFGNGCGMVVGPRWVGSSLKKIKINAYHHTQQQKLQMPCGSL